MTSPTMTLNQIQQKGLEVLARELGPVGIVRFLQMFEAGSGDYTVDRQQWLGDQQLEDIVQRIRQRRAIKGEE